VSTCAWAEVVGFRRCDLLIDDPTWLLSIVAECFRHFHRSKEFQMSVVSYIPSADPDARAVDLPRDIAARLHALLVSRRDEAAAQLERLATAEDPSFGDEHEEISATVASETLRDVEYALSRIDAGTYGSCEVCGAAIPPERLEAVPHATTCVDCAAA
jgi:RNA polymerase-binding transcription factor